MVYMIVPFLKRLFFIKKAPWSERHFLFILIIAAILAALVSLAIGLNQSVWFDEAYSIFLAKQPVAELIRLTSIDGHPPLYYLLLKGWAAMFGFGELALRSLNAIMMGGVIVVAGLLAKRLFGVRAALLTLPLLVVAPFMLRYGFEIRMYALAALIGIAATYVLVVARQTSNSRRQWLLYATYAVLVALGVYTLYYTALLWVAHLVWLLWVTLKDRQSLLSARWPAAFAASVILFIPWLPTFLSQLGNGALSPVVRTLTLEQLLGIVTFNFLYQPVWQPGVIGSFLILLVIITLTYFAIKAFKYASVREREYLVLLGLYVLVPVLLLMLVSLNKPMYIERYLAHLIVGGLLFIGATMALTLTHKKSVTSWVAAGIVLAVMIGGAVHLMQIGNYNFQRSQLPTTKYAAEVVASDCSGDAVVVAKDPYVAIELLYYLPHCQVYFFSETAELSGGYAPVSNSPLHVVSPNDLIGLAERVYYIYDGEPDADFSGRFHELSDQVFDTTHVREFSVE
jgi:mannosyltransferase